MLALRLDSLDSAFNLALEETLFHALRPGDPGWFLLWRNGPSIIVGRHQNTLEEINTDLVRTYGLPVVRRMTGGGAVYHDAGNLNFSFLMPSEGRGRLDFKRFLRPVLTALAELGVTAAFSSRNDITVGGRKVSGSAQLRSSHGVLHHGTLLVHLDLDMLGAVLAGAPDKYTSKGVASIRSRVCNLAEVLPAGIGMEGLRDALTAHCAQGEGAVSAPVWEEARVLAARKYRSWNWNYGASPPFSERRRRRFPWGAVECRFDVRHGRIAGCRIYGDFFSQSDIGRLETLLTGIPYTEAALREALGDRELDDFFSGCDTAIMRAFLISD